MGTAWERQINLIQDVMPHLEKINEETRLSVFLGVQSELNAVIIAKADFVTGLKISSDIGDSHPLFAGAGGKALLSQLSDAAFEDLLAQAPLKAYTPYTCQDNALFKKIIADVRLKGYAFDIEEYTEGIHALAVPLRVNKTIPAAIWAVGLKKQLPESKMKAFAVMMKKIASEIEEQRHRQ